MIRTVVVDDDFMAVLVHREFTERVPGFEVVGEARSGRAALELVDQLRPDLLLLDIYLPDVGGLEVLRQLRAEGRGADVDVIAITSAKDVDVLRGAMHLGVAHYVVKPFTFATFRERLESYAAARRQLEGTRQPGQRDVDRVFGLLRASTREGLPKGISAPTLALVVDLVRRTPTGISAGDLAEQAGFSQGVARRYLRYLCDTGELDLRLRYGSTGRPEHVYQWSGVSPA